MAHNGEINRHLLLNTLDRVDFISYSMKIKNFLNYISSVIYSSESVVYDKFNNISSDEYFTLREKEEFLKDLLSAGYKCANPNIIESSKLRRKNPKMADLINELLPILKMKISFNDTSMFVIDFYLIDRRDYVGSAGSAGPAGSRGPKEVKLPFHFSMRLAPHDININSPPTKCSKFGDYDNSINILNKDNNYGIPHVTFECYKDKYEDSKRGGMFKSNKDPRSREVNIAPDLNMFPTQMQQNTMGTNFRGMPPPNPNFQEMSQFNPNFRGMPPPNPNFQEMSQFNPNFRGMPPPNPNFQEMSQFNPNFRGMPPPNPNFQEMSQFNPNFRGMPPPNPNFQEMSQFNPNFRGMPPPNPNFRGMPPPNPNFRGMPYPSNTYMQEMPMVDDINIPNDPIIGNIRDSRDIEVSGAAIGTRRNIGVIGDIGARRNIGVIGDIGARRNIGVIGDIGAIRDTGDIGDIGAVGELYNSGDKKGRRIHENVCNDYKISHVSRNNHAYLYVLEDVPYENFFNYFIDLLSNKGYVSNISNLINIEKTEDTDDISCIQKNNGDKSLIDIYINMALKAVGKLLTAYKKYYDSTILKILKDPENTRDKLIRYISSVESSAQRTDAGMTIFRNNAIKYELQVLNNLLCSIDADNDYIKYLDLSIRLYNEYLEKYIAYEESILHILTCKNITDISNHLSRTIYNFGELMIKYNMYIVNAFKAYASYTHMNSIGIENYSNIDARVVNISDFNNTVNFTKVSFIDKFLINYYLVLPNNIVKNNELIKNIYAEIDRDNLETHLQDLIKSYTHKGTNFNESYIYNIIIYILDLYFEQLAGIIINKDNNIISEATYHSNLGSLKDKYSTFINIIADNQKYQKAYKNKKSDFIKKYRKIDYDIEEYLSNTLARDQEPAKKGSSSVSKSKLSRAHGGMPPKSPKKIKPIDYKQAIIDNLKILADYEKLNKEPFKTRAYNKVIESLEILEEPISNLEDFKKIKGVGDKIALKIKELIETGKITAVENALKDSRYSLQKQLGKLYGVGPVKLNELMSKITSFDELYKNPDLLNDKQKIGLKYYKDMELRIPISEGKKHYKIIDKTFKLTNDKIEFELVGSYRRKNKDMGDIDILIKNGEDLILKKLIANLVDSGYIIETLASGKSKFMGLCKLSPDLPARRIDILIAEPSYYYFALLYFTGSYSFNIYMRKIALEKGYSLSEYGLKGKDNKIIDTSDIIKSEEDIFKFLNIPYVTPEKRNIA